MSANLIRLARTAGMSADELGASLGRLGIRPPAVQAGMHPRGLGPRQITGLMNDLNVPRSQQSLVMQTLEGRSGPISGADVNDALFATMSPAKAGAGASRAGAGMPVPRDPNDGMLVPKVSKPGELVPYSKYSEDALANKGPVLTGLERYAAEDGMLVPKVSSKDGMLVPKVSSKSTATQGSNQATASSKVGSTAAADITGYAGSTMGGLAAVGVGAGVGGVTSYATGGEFGKGAVAGGMVAGGAYLGMSAMATNSKAINAAVAKGGEGFGAGVMGAMQGANQVIGSASVAGRRAALMGGAGLAGLTFGGNRRSHRRGFNQSRGSRI